MTRPAKLSTLRHLFSRAVTNIMGDRGEPAELGKSDAGPVFYDDGTTVHKNRIWARKGANSEVLIRVRADGFNVPDTPGVPIRVEERGGIFWLVSWQEEDYTPEASGGSGGSPMEVLLNATDFSPGFGATIETYQGLLGPVWDMPNSSANKRIHTLMPVPYDCTQIRISTYYGMLSNFSGVNRLTVEVGSMESAEDTTGPAIHDYDTTSATEDVSSPANGSTLGVWTVTLDLNNTLTAGDLLGVEFRRAGNTSGTTNTGQFNFAGMRIEFVDADAGGGTSSGTGVHKFHASEIMPADNTTLEHDAAVTRPFIEFPDSVVGTALMSFLAEKTNASFDIDVYSVSGLGGSGDVVLDADVYRAATDGTESPGDDNAFVSSAAYTHDGFIQTHSITVSFSGGATTAPGDYCSAVLIRIGNSTTPADNLSDDLHVLMVVVTENGDG